MSLQEQVARRRAEQAGDEEASRRMLAHVEQKAREDEQRRREEVVERTADELAAAGLPVRREGEVMSFVKPPKPIDVEGVRRSALTSLLDREARSRWTPGDNWLVISCVAAGIALLHLGGLGIVPLAFGLWRGHVLNARYKAQVLDEHPELAALLAATPT